MMRSMNTTEDKVVKQTAPSTLQIRITDQVNPRPVTLLLGLSRPANLAHRGPTILFGRVLPQAAALVAGSLFVDKRTQTLKDLLHGLSSRSQAMPEHGFADSHDPRSLLIGELKNLSQDQSNLFLRRY